MSARVVAVARLLLDVLDEIDARSDGLTLSEVALFELLADRKSRLVEIEATAVAEMQALAPVVLAVSA